MARDPNCDCGKAFGHETWCASRVRGDRDNRRQQRVDKRGEREDKKKAKVDEAQASLRAAHDRQEKAKENSREIKRLTGRAYSTEPHVFPPGYTSKKVGSKYYIVPRNQGN